MNAPLASLGLRGDPVESTEIEFGEWLPDQPAHNNPGAIEALNVVPLDGHYAPFKQHNPQTNALPETARGATAVISSDDVVQVYAGSVNGLYSRFGGAAFIQLLTQITSEDNSWQFVRANEQMVGIHREVKPVRSPVGTLTPFVTLGGNPPIAGCGAQVGDFLMLGNLRADPDDGNALVPNRVRWGGFNNIDAPWITNPATQADFQDMPDEGGQVVAISGREYATIFQARMISRGRYTGLPNVFEFVVAEDKRGCIARDCVVDVGYNKFFIAEDGFFVWNGTNAVPIGDARVNSYFFSRLQYGKRSRIVGAADFVNGCVMWAFPTSTSGLLDEIIIYSYRDNKWSHSIQTLEYLFNSAYSNLTVEELTNPAESYTTSFDDASYRAGGRTQLAAFNSSHAYGVFDGPNMAATIDTGEYSGPNGRRVFVNDARPMVDLDIPYATMQAVMRDQMLGQAVTFGDAVAQELDGRCPIMGDARYMRFRVNIPAAVPWKQAVGVEISRKATGAY